MHERADKLAQITQGMTREEIRKLIAPDGKPPAPSADARAEIDKLVAARKREIIERECFGLIEFVTPQHGFDVVGGMDEVKKDLLLVAKNIREGKRNRVPMGILFTGPMGTGKTFVAEAFAKECGLTTIKLKNFRSKWVGATEGNLERILSVIQAIGQIIVIIDEGDRAFGGGDGDGDGGTSSRVIGRIKEFMSDTENRGRVLFILMTNRPDKLDVDIKRAGRLDRKIPFLYPQTGDEVVNVLKAQFKKNKVKAEIDFDARDRRWPNRSSDTRTPTSKRSSCWPTIIRGDDAGARTTIWQRAMKDYLPSRDVQMLEYMELLAVFEASNRRMLPKKYADVPVDELQARLQLLKAQVRIAALGERKRRGDMDFFPEVHLSHDAAEAIARGLFAIARGRRRARARGGPDRQLLDRRRRRRAAQRPRARASRSSRPTWRRRCTRTPSGSCSSRPRSCSPGPTARCRRRRRRRCATSPRRSASTTRRSRRSTRA